MLGGGGFEREVVNEQCEKMWVRVTYLPSSKAEVGILRSCVMWGAGVRFRNFSVRYRKALARSLSRG